MALLFSHTVTELNVQDLRCGQEADLEPTVGEGGPGLVEVVVILLVHASQDLLQLVQLALHSLVQLELLLLLHSIGPRELHVHI